MKQHYFFLWMLFCCSFLSTAYAQQPAPVRFNSGNEFFPTNFGAAGLAKPAADEIINGYYARYIQCTQIPTTAEKQAMESSGVRFVSYVNFGAYLTLIPEKFDLRQMERMHVRSIVPVQTLWKTARSLREKPYSAWAVQGDLLDINVQVYPHIAIALGADLCRRQGMEVLKQGKQNGFLSVRIHKDHVDAVAALPFVRFIELIQEPGKPEDIKGRSLHRSNLLDSDHGSGKKYNGEGVSILVRDDGRLGPHIDFQGRLNNFAEGPETAGTHGDGVGGIMAGAGNLDPSKKGMAAGARVFATDYEASYQDTTLWLHQNENVTVTNSSYSNGCNVGYTIASQTVDQQIFENPTLMHVFSAGNANGTSCNYGAGDQWGNITGGHKMAKNAIATANLLADGTLDASSSRGPAHDGRMKPDISANGTDQESTNPNNGYQVFGGTSGAAPGIVGCLAQLTQAYKTISNGDEPQSALLKATLLNTANDLGNTGPDYRFGWGHVNTFRALRLLELNRWVKGSVSQGETKTHTIQIPNNTRLVKVMVYWADQPSDEGASRTLINDVDIKVTNSTTSFLPWKLDPTPDPTMLNTPAGKGRDSLNNVEQVAIENPASGTYTVRVTGTEVPFGPQEYFMVWELLNDQVKVVYPNGGEGVSSGDTVRLHWDAYGLPTTNFTLRLLNADGTFSPISTQAGTKRMHDWRVPANLTGKVRFLLVRGSQRDTSDQFFVIAPALKNITVLKVCPDSMTLGWDKINDTLNYAVYTLGQKYMEIAGIADTNFLSFSIVNPQLPKWYSAAAMPDGLAGKRAIAQRWPGGLKKCRQPEDAAVRDLIAPAGGAIIRCTPGDQEVQIKIKNEGLNPLTNAIAHYQIDSQVPVDEVVPVIPPGDSLNYVFKKKIAVNFNGNINLKIWINYPGDDYLYNDSLQVEIPVVSMAQQGAFSETVEGANFPPSGWIITNPDNDKTWEKRAKIEGSNGQETTAFYFNCYDYRDRGAEDILYTIPVNLTGMTKPTLIFDVAHARFDVNYAEELRVEIQGNCDPKATPVVVWEKTDPELGTTANSTLPFVPVNRNEWRTEGVDLSAYSGQSVIIRFVGTNDYGNNIFLDNIGVTNAVPPKAEFSASLDTICRQDTVVFAVPAVAVGVNYAWSFGLGALPYATSTDPGPHKIRYSTAGSRTIRMIVSTPFGNDTATQVIRVLNIPIANFTAKPNALVTTFTNTSTNAIRYRWNFGDDSTSTVANPVHTYAKEGTYTVKLIASNACRTVERTVVITVTTVGTNDLGDAAQARILPNPTAGDFTVELESHIADTGRFNLLDAQGRLIKSVTISIQPGKQLIPFNGLNLPKGLYQVQVQLSSASQTFSVSVQ